MIVRKLVFGLAAAFAIAAAAGVAVVAAAFALFALLRDALGPSGAAAVVVGVAALLIALLGLALALMARPPRPKPEDASVAARAMDFAKEKPLIALGALAIGGFLLARNPKIATIALASLFAKPSSPKR